MNLPHTISQDMGDYVIDRLLSDAGGMAYVFLGYQKPPAARKVAIKILREDLAKDPGIVERFKFEVASGAAMQHDHIVLYLAYGERDARPYIVMEFIDGWDLRTWLDNRDGPQSLGSQASLSRKLPMPVALLVLRDVALALEYAHDKNVIHRDIKPSNVMLTREGNVKLMDFGIARATRHSDRTVMGTLIGTPSYMSPEQARGLVPEGDEGKLSDVFSFGTLAYELLAGSAPFTGTGLAEVLDAVRFSQPNPLSAVNPLVPWEIVNLVKQMHEKDPARRGAGFGKIARTFDRAIDQLGVKADRRFLRRYVEDPENFDPGMDSGRVRLPVPVPDPGPPAPLPLPWWRSRRGLWVVTAGVVTLMLVLWGGRNSGVHATLEITSSPAGALVRINGRPHGTTPAVVLNLPVGKTTIELSKGGYQQISETLVLAPGTNTLERGLEAVPPASEPTATPEIRSTPAGAPRIQRGIAREQSAANVRANGKPSGITLEPQLIHYRTYRIQPTRFDVEITVDDVTYTFPDTLRLREGPHTIHVTGPGAGEAFDLIYTVTRGDGSKTLIINVTKKTIAPSPEIL